MFNVTHAFLDALRARKGRVVNIGSIQSFMHVRWPNSVAYTTSQHGVLGLSRRARQERRTGQRDRPRPDRDAAQRGDPRQESRRRERLPRTYAARPHRNARGRRRPGALPGF
jgi:hypothetical protein